MEDENNLEKHRITLDEYFLRFFQGKDEFLVEECKNLFSDYIFAVYRGGDLYENVNKILKQGRLPLYDKKTATLFSTIENSHQIVSACLHSLHTDNFVLISPGSSTKFISQNYGWYVSSVNGKTLIKNGLYRGSKREEECFQMLKDFLMEF
jgi:hypothetical protein